MLAYVPHDRDLAFRHRPAAITAQDAGFIYREDVRILAAGEERAPRRHARMSGR